MTYRLSDEDREALTCDCEESSRDADWCPFHAGHDHLSPDLPAQVLLARVEAIVARKVAAAEAERAAETRRADKAVERARHYEGQFRQREHEPDWRKRAEAAEAKVAAVEALAEKWQAKAMATSGVGAEHYPWAMWLHRANDLRAALGEARP